MKLRSYWLNRRVRMIVDRPIGFHHPQVPALIYSLNYGFVPGTRAADNEPIDIYLLNENKPVRQAEAFVVGIIHRLNDTEDKLVGSRKLIRISPAGVMKHVQFVERWFDVEIETVVGNDRFSSMAE